MSCYSQDVSIDSTDSSPSPSLSAVDELTMPCSLLKKLCLAKQTGMKPAALLKSALSKKSQPVAPAPQPQSAANYKTELCKNFELGKACKWGPGCSFAHGKAELRLRTQKDELRNKSCRGYNETGFCSYGVRCQFLHSKPFKTFREKLDFFEFAVTQGVEEQPREPLARKLEAAANGERRLSVFQGLAPAGSGVALADEKLSLV